MSKSSRTRGNAEAGEFDGASVDGAFATDGDVFDDGVFAVDRSSTRGDERAGEPLRVCLACGDEDPSDALEGASCQHTEVAVFAEAPAEAIAAADRVRRALAELAKAQRALSGMARGAVTAGEAVIDERAPASQATTAAKEPVECAACAERATLEATERPKVKRGKRARGTSDEASESPQATFDFLAVK